MTRRKNNLTPRSFIIFNPGVAADDPRASVLRLLSPEQELGAVMLGTPPKDGR